MELTPKLNENVMNALAEALKGLKPRPAVDRVLTARLTGKWTHYAQILLAYSPTEYGLAYVNLDKPSEPKVKIHDAESKAGKFATSKELKRLRKAEASIERKTKAEEKAKAKTTKTTEPKPKAAAKTPKAKKTKASAPVVKFDPSVPTLE